MKKMKKISFAIVLLIVAFSAYAQSNAEAKKVKAKADSAVFFFAGFELESGLYVMSEPDSTMFNKKNFEIQAKMLEFKNKPQIMRLTAASLDFTRIPLKDNRAPIMFFFKDEEELNTAMNRLKYEFDNSIYYLMDFKFDKALEIGPGNPQVR